MLSGKNSVHIVMTDHPIEIALESYQTNIKKLIEYLSDGHPEEHGFYSSVTSKVNKTLAEHKDKIPDQYVPDWYGGKKAQKRGLDIISAVKLGYGGGLSKDPNLACALVYLALMGVWDPELESLSSIKKRLGGDAYIEDIDTELTVNADQLDRIELKLDRAVSLLESSGHTATKKENLTWGVVKELTKFGMQPTKANIPKIKRILESHAVGIETYIPEVISILKNDTDPDPKYWLLICALLNAVNPDGKYSPETIKNWINPQEARQDSPNASQNKDPDK